MGRLTDFHMVFKEICVRPLLDLQGSCIFEMGM